MRRKAIVKGCMLVCLLTAIPSTQGSLVTIDPYTGWSGYFHWSNGPGPLDGIQTGEYVQDQSGNHLDPWTTGPGPWAWSITLPADGMMALIHVWDDYLPGDKFALKVDGATVPWTTTYYVPSPSPYVGSSYFHGKYADLGLSAGEHTLTLDIAAGSWLKGAGHAYFSPMTPVAVPAPGAVLLGAIGISMVGGLGRRRLLGSNSSSYREVIRHS